YSLFFLSGRIRDTSSKRDWSSDVCSSDLVQTLELIRPLRVRTDCMLPSGLMVVDSVLVLFHWVSQVKSIIRLSKGRKRAPTVTTAVKLRLDRSCTLLTSSGARRRERPMRSPKTARYKNGAEK